MCVCVCCFVLFSVIFMSDRDLKFFKPSIPFGRHLLLLPVLFPLQRKGRKGGRDGGTEGERKGGREGGREEGINEGTALKH